MLDRLERLGMTVRAAAVFLGVWLLIAIWYLWASR